MIIYLVICSLLIPLNLWAAITPHLHTDLLMRILHSFSTLILLPLMTRVWMHRQKLSKYPVILLEIYSIHLILVNGWITIKGVGVGISWLDHLMLAIAELTVPIFFLLEPNSKTVQSTNIDKNL